MVGRRKYIRRIRVVRVGRRARGKGGEFNLKTVIAGAIGLTSIKALRSRIVDLGNYNQPADSILTGVALKMLKLDNMDLVSAGIKQGVAQAANDLLLNKIGGGIKTEEGV